MASVNDINFLPPIDYTARDYEAIKAALIKHVQTFFPNDHTDFTEGGLGAIILEFVAYVGDQLSFYLDRQVNEMFLPTAVQRQSVLNLVNLVGYVPRSTSAAIADIKGELQVAQVDPTLISPFTVFVDKNGTQWEFLETITIPAGRTDTNDISIVDEVLGTGDGSTRIFSFLTANNKITDTSAILKVTISAVQYVIDINSDGTIPVPFNGTGVIDFDTGLISLTFTSGNEPDAASSILLTYDFDQDIKAYQGVHNLDVFSSDGGPDQKFVLTKQPVLVSAKTENVEISPNPNRFEVWVGNAGLPYGDATGTLWSRTDSLAVAGPTETVYEISFDDQDRLILTFGDNGAGAIPPSGVNNLSIIYRTGGGAIGNVAANFISSSVTGSAGLLSTTVTVSNPEASTGGRERESLNEIRVNAPAFLRTNETATTEQDFDTLAIFSRSGLGSVTRAKSRLTPSILLTTKTLRTTEVLTSVPALQPLQYFLLLPATPILPATIQVDYVVGSITRQVTANDLGSGLASLTGDANLNAATRLRYDEQTFTAESLAFGDGSTFDFAATLAGFPVFPGSVIFRYTIGGVEKVGYDDRNGLLIATDVLGDGTIDYSTGAVVLEFGTHGTALGTGTAPFDMDATTLPSTITVAVDGGSPQTVTFENADFAINTAATAAEVKTVLDADLVGVTVTLVGTNPNEAIQIASNTFGPTSSILVAAGSPNDGNTALLLPVTLKSGLGTAPDNATALSFDYQSCLDLQFVTSPDIGTEILFTAESGPNQIEIPSNNIEIYTWAEDSEGNLIPPSTALRDTLKNSLDPLRVLATSIEILAGFNVKVRYNITTGFDPSVNQTEAIDKIVAALETFFSSVVDVAPGLDVGLSSVYSSITEIQGVIDPVITEVGVRVPIGLGDGVNAVFTSNALVPGRFISTSKIPAKAGADLISVFRGNTEIGDSDAATPVVALSGSEVIGGSTFNKDTGVFDVRITPAPGRDEIISIDYLLDEVTTDTIWNIDINEWEIAVLGDVFVNGIKVN